MNSQNKYLASERAIRIDESGWKKESGEAQTNDPIKAENSEREWLPAQLYTMRFDTHISSGCEGPLSYHSSR